MDFIDYIFERFLAFEAGLGLTVLVRKWLQPCLEIDAKILGFPSKISDVKHKILSVHRLLGMLEGSDLQIFLELVLQFRNEAWGTSIRTDYIYNLHVIYVIYVIYVTYVFFF